MASMTLTDPIVQPSRGTVDQVYDFAVEQGAQRLPFLRDYLEESWRLSEIDGIDFSEMSAQSAHETGNWAGKGFENNTNWTELGNPAGLAITNSENKSVNYKSGTDAARAHHVHMWLYRYGPLKPGDALYQYRDLDGHYTEAATGTNTYSTNKPYAASVKTLADFQPNGQWALLLPYPAAGDRYGDRIVKKAKEIWGNDLKVEDPPVTTPSTPEEPVEPGAPVATYNYDNGVPPDYVDIHVSEANKFAGYIDPDNHWIGIFFIHSAYGDLEGTTGWMVGGNALTDTMVGNSYDGPALDGQLRRFNNAYGNRYAWSSGPVKNPVEDAAKFLELYGPNKEVINSHGTAMERSCGPNVATNHVTEKEHRKRCQEIAYHANKYGKRIKKLTGKDGLTCDTFPLIATENNRSFLAYHGEANEDKRETCPDKHVRATIDRIIADVRVILAGWQLGAVTIPPLPEEPNPQDKYAAVKVIPELQAYLGNDANGNPILPPAIVTVGKRVYVMVNDRVKATKAIKRRQTAEEDAEVIGPVIAKGTEFAALWLFQNDDGTPWYITPWWTRIPVADTTRVADAA